MNVADIKGSEHRKAEHPVDPMFLDRWSPRAMTGEALSRTELLSLLEAARWAPSSYNGQPWRILYATRDSDHWPAFYDLLVEFNQIWCKNAAALLVFVSRKSFDHNGQSNVTHSYDTGAAWMSLALQGARMGLVVHGMSGFNYEKAVTILNIPEGYQVEAMAAVGRPGPIDSLPEGIAAKEQPSSRKNVNEFAFEGGFPQD